MDRFSRLEFGDDTTPRDGKPRGEPIRDAEYYHQEALKYWLAADYELALRHYSRMLEQNSALFDAWAGQVLMLIELGEYPEACVWADKALGFFPEHPELLALKGLACLRDARMEQAVAYSDNSVGKDNLTPRVWLVRAEVFLDRKGPIAEGCVNKAVACAGKSLPLVHLEAGRLFGRKGRHLQAIQHLKQAVEGFPRSALAWYELGCCQVSLGLAEAVHSLEQSCALRPDWESAKTMLRKAEKRGFFRGLFGR
ncbi:MAG TPA: tetratricopeptide repeat protein [Sedimentisphaerales bacterium]|nr:tetratricopeptide repeat protein [Sedimentisphaerales bacterium]